MAEQIVSSKGEYALIAIQSSLGTFNLPLASNAVSLVSHEWKQKEVFAENKEMKDGYAQQPAKYCGLEIGDWKLTANLKVTGTPGALPTLHALLIAGYGRHTVTGSEVSYSHYRKGVDSLIYLSVIVKKEAETYFITDAVVNSVTFKTQKKEIQQIEFSGFFFKKVIAGVSALKTTINGTSTPVTVLPLDNTTDYRRFDADALLQIGTATNSGAGYKITSINEGGNTLTIDPGVNTEIAAGAVIKGFAPTPVFSGNDVAAKTAWYEKNGDSANKIGLSNIEVSIDNGIKKIDDELSYDEFNGRAVPDTRKVKFTSEKYYGLKDVEVKDELRKEISIPLVWKLGKEIGSSIKVIFPNLKIQEKDESGSPEVKQKITFAAYESAGNDESTLVFY